MNFEKQVINNFTNISILLPCTPEGTPSRFAGPSPEPGPACPFRGAGQETPFYIAVPSPERGRHVPAEGRAGDCQIGNTTNTSASHTAWEIIKAGRSAGLNR